jgi:hypothetical protein
MTLNDITVVPNDDEDIQKFAEALGISVERAKYIEAMRPVYLAWEHDYLKTPPKLKKPRRKIIK